MAKFAHEDDDVNNNNSVSAKDLNDFFSTLMAQRKDYLYSDTVPLFIGSVLDNLENFEDNYVISFEEYQAMTSSAVHFTESIVEENDLDDDKKKYLLGMANNAFRLALGRPKDDLPEVRVGNDNFVSKDGVELDNDDFAIVDSIPGKLKELSSITQNNVIKNACLNLIGRIDKRSNPKSEISFVQYRNFVTYSIRAFGHEEPGWEGEFSDKAHAIFADSLEKGRDIKSYMADYASQTFMLKQFLQDIDSYVSIDSGDDVLIFTAFRDIIKENGLSVEDDEASLSSTDLFKYLHEAEAEIGGKLSYALTHHIENLLIQYSVNLDAGNDFDSSNDVGGIIRRVIDVSGAVIARGDGGQKSSSWVNLVSENTLYSIESLIVLASPVFEDFASDDGKNAYHAVVDKLCGDKIFSSGFITKKDFYGLLKDEGLEYNQHDNKSNELFEKIDDVFVQLTFTLSKSNLVDSLRDLLSVAKRQSYDVPIIPDITGVLSRLLENVAKNFEDDLIEHDDVTKKLKAFAPVKDLDDNQQNKLVKLIMDKAIEKARGESRGWGF